MSRGALIVIEGIDRCGKTSQSLKLIDSLKKINIPAERMNFPDRTTWTGQVISKYLSDKTFTLNDQAIHLLFSSNRWESVNKILDWLNNGVTVVLDRYLYSGVAFSSAKGLDFHWCVQPEIGLPKPDLVLYLEILSEVQTRMPGFGAERYETSAFQEKVAEAFQKFSADDNWKTVDGNRTFDEVHMDLIKNIEAKVNEVSKLDSPLKYFSYINRK